MLGAPYINKHKFQCYPIVVCYLRKVGPNSLNLGQRPLGLYNDACNNAWGLQQTYQCFLPFNIVHPVLAQGIFNFPLANLETSFLLNSQTTLGLPLSFSFSLARITPVRVVGVLSSLPALLLFINILF